MRVTLEVEFKGASDEVLENSLQRGKEALQRAIEDGVGGLPNGIERGSVKITVVRKLSPR